MNQAERTKDEFATRDPYWDKLVCGIMEHGSPQERRAVLSIAHHAAHDELRHPGERLPKTMGHGRMRRLPKALRRA